MIKKNSCSMEIKTSMSLLQYMGNEGLVPTPEEEIKRTIVIHKLNKILMEWAKTVAHQRGFQTGYAMASCASVRVFGSYGLGVHDSSSDIDALCVAPHFTTLEDFFGSLHDMLTSTIGISSIICIKNGKVPLLRFDFDGIQFDLPYAKLNANTILEVVDVLHPFLLKDIDEKSWTSMTGVVANTKILELVPNIKEYQSLLRCIKFWAKMRGIYGFAFGYFGGIHLAVLAAYVCRKQPNAPLSALVSCFFETYASWSWQRPVILEDTVLQNDIVVSRPILMPIHLPGSKEYIWSNTTKSTLNRIQIEFERARALTKNILLPDFDWRPLFEPFSCRRNYERFLKISISCAHENELKDWVGWVKSRLRHLLFKLDDFSGLCNPDSTEYEDTSLNEPNKVLYWGLDIEKSKAINIKYVQACFMANIQMGQQEGSIGGMNLKIVNVIYGYNPNEDSNIAKVLSLLQLSN